MPNDPMMSILVRARREDTDTQREGHVKTKIRIGVAPGAG